MAEVLTTDDGVKLHLRRWPAIGAVHGTVQIVHGLGEHIGRYEALAASLNAAGWHVAGHDQRGHGLSTGPRGGIAAKHALLADLSAVSDHFRDVGKHILLGHSLGGVVAARLVAESLMYKTRRWAREFDGLALSSPAFDPGLNPLSKLALPLLARLAPGLGLSNGLDPNWICRDAEIVRQYRADPLVHRRVTPRLARFIVKEGRVVLGRARRWRTPTLLLWAGADRCVVPAGSARFAAASPPQLLTAQVFPGLFHEIFNEPEREQVVGALTQWLERFQSSKLA